MGRAIIRDLPVFLFGEPLSNLDAKLFVDGSIDRLNQVRFVRSQRASATGQSSP
ncbi:hypothetical protein LPU83_pLPU83c_0161 (plasmid) [Rhizobium favelukesii]|uniref:Uncharacterized protein n=1 Tax=Rhizobium favelukesii TaxID=348824 RepID=W6RPE4_9HYPH|nr:hypothetical protein LPU83_pLPU83c_0161 [Rhizobium favelukesii]